MPRRKAGKKRKKRETRDFCDEELEEFVKMAYYDAMYGNGYFRDLFT